MNNLLNQIIQTPHRKLINQTLQSDYQYKKWLIETIEFYQTIYNDKPTQLVKDIINSLMDDLDKRNKMIDLLIKIRNLYPEVM